MILVVCHWLCQCFMPMENTGRASGTHQGTVDGSLRHNRPTVHWRRVFRLLPPEIANCRVEAGTEEIADSRIKIDFTRAGVVDVPVSRCIIDGPGTAVWAQVHPLLVNEAQRSCSDSCEDGNLVAGFINRSVSIDAFRDTQRFAPFGNPERRDQLRRWPWAETGTSRRVR